MGHSTLIDKSIGRNAACNQDILEGLIQNAIVPCLMNATSGKRPC